MIVECRCSLCCRLPKGYDLINHRQAVRHQRRHPAFAFRQAAQVRRGERQKGQAAEVRRGERGEAARSQERPELPERAGVEREELYVLFLGNIKHLLLTDVVLNAVSMIFCCAT